MVEYATSIPSLLMGDMLNVSKDMVILYYLFIGYFYYEKRIRSCSWNNVILIVFNTFITFYHFY